MSGRVLVSIVIPVYNGAPYLAEAISSALGQSYAPLEIIVVDDGSEDDSAAIARSFPEVRYQSQAHQGVTGARNAGIARACGSYIAFLDQDDRWLPEKLSRQMSALEAEPSCRYALCHLEIFLDERGRHPHWLREEILGRPHPGFTPSSLLARRDLFDEIGLFDPAYPATSDAEWLFRAKDRGVPYVMLPDVLVERRIHGANHSRMVAAVQADLLQIVRASVRRQRGGE